MSPNLKSDVAAKTAYISQLNNAGFQDARIVSTPSDIIAFKDGQQWYFEIKMTTKSDSYFGAATQTEWKQAFKTPETFRFVVALKNDTIAGGYEFFEFTPIEFMQYSTVPPFKIFFNISIKELKEEQDVRKKTRFNRRKKAIRFTKEIFDTLQQTWDRVKEL